MLWLVFLLAALGVQSGFQLARGDEITPAFWFTWTPILLFAHLVRLAWRRLIRSPRLTLEDGLIRTSFTESGAKQVVADRVTEVQIDERRSLIRFFIPDGLSLAVRADLLESGAADSAEVAHGFADALGVPVVQVRRRVWGWRRTEVSTTPV